jgi:hypothetical protein
VTMSERDVQPHRDLSEVIAERRTVAAAAGVLESACGTPLARGRRRCGVDPQGACFRATVG